MFVTVNRANIFCASAGAIKYKFSVYARAWLIMIVYMELIVRLENKGWRVGLFVQTREHSSKGNVPGVRFNVYELFLILVLVGRDVG